MKVLDTNTLTHLFGGHQRVVETFARESEDIATTVISRIEILQGRFAMLLEAADGRELQRAQRWFDFKPSSKFRFSLDFWVNHTWLTGCNCMEKTPPGKRKDPIYSIL